MKVIPLLAIMLTLVGNSFASTSRFKYDRFKDTCVDESGSPGLNLGEVGECSDFSGLDLRNSDLSNKNLKGSYFFNANLEGANLSGADIRGAKFQDSILTNTFFEGAWYSETSVLPFEYLEMTKRKLKEFLYKDLDAAFEERSRYVFNEETEKALSTFLDLGADPNVKKGRAFSIIIRSGSDDLVKKMIQSGAKVNAQILMEDDTYLYPLVVAIKSNRLSIVKLLLDNKANPDNGDALLPALVLNNYPMIEALINSGANISKLSKDFMYYTGDSKVWDLLLKTSPSYPINLRNINSLNQLKVVMKYGFKLTTQNYEGDTLLIKWIRERKPLDDIKEILKYDCNINAVTYYFNHQSAFSAAVENKQFNDLLPLLIQAGAVPIGKIDEMDVVEYMVKHYGSKIEVIKLLCPFGKYLKTNFNIFLTSIDFNKQVHGPLIEEMLRTGAVFDYADRGQLSDSILLHTIQDRKEQLFNFLLEKNININFSRGTVTPLHLAATKNDCSYVRSLINHGADLNMRAVGSPALHTATPECGKVLVEAGADVNALSQLGENTITFLRPYLCNVENMNKRYVDYLRYLLNAGINHKRVDRVGNSLLHVLAKGNAYCNEKLITEFNDVIFDYNVKNDLGQNALVSALPSLVDSKETVFWKYNPTFLAAQTKLIKFLIAKGVDPKISYRFSPTEGEVSLLQGSYRAFNMESMRFLQALGLKDFKWKTTMRKGTTWTRADCDFFDTRKGYKIDQGGCLSSSGLVWSRPIQKPLWKKVDYEKYCEDLNQGNRTDWRPASDVQIQTEALRQGLKSDAWERIITSDSYWSSYMDVKIYSYDSKTNYLVDDSEQYGSGDYHYSCVADSQRIQ